MTHDQQNSHQVLHQLELEQERHMADNLVAAMQPDLREKFMQLKSANAQYSTALEQMNQELDLYTSKKVSLEDELAVSAIKREAVVLYEQLAEAESKRDKLLEEALWVRLDPLGSHQ